MVSNIPDILKDAINEILSLVKLMSSVAVNDDFRRLYGGLITAMLKQVEISLPDSVSLHDFLCIAELRPVYHMLSINTDTLDISFRRGLKSLKTFLEWRYWDNKQPISPNDLAFFDRINSLYVSDMTDVRWDLLDHLYKQVLRSATRSMEARLAAMTRVAPAEGSSHEGIEGPKRVYDSFQTCNNGKFIIKLRSMQPP